MTVKFLTCQTESKREDTRTNVHPRPADVSYVQHRDNCLSAYCTENLCTARRENAGGKESSGRTPQTCAQGDGAHGIQEHDAFSARTTPGRAQPKPGQARAARPGSAAAGGTQRADPGSSRTRRAAAAPPAPSGGQRRRRCGAASRGARGDRAGTAPAPQPRTPPGRLPSSGC